MKLIFYGTTGAVPTKDNTNVSFTVIAENISLLVDTSGCPTHALLKTGIHPPDLNAVVLTHAHPDHLYAFPSLIHNLWLLKRKKPLYIISNQDTATKAKQLYEVFSLLTKEGLFPIEWITFEEGSIDLFPGLLLTLFPVKHSAPACGVKISTTSSSLVYSSDTTPSERVVQAAKGATALIHEATGSEHHEEQLNADGHSSARQAGTIAEQAGIATLYLCHFDFRQGIVPAKLQHEAQAAFSGQVIIPELFKFYEV